MVAVVVRIANRHAVHPFPPKPFGTVEQNTSPDNYLSRLPRTFEEQAALLVLPASKWLSVRGTWSDEQCSQVRAEMGGIGWASCGKVSRTFPGQSARSFAPVEAAEHKTSFKRFNQTFAELCRESENLVHSIDFQS